MKRDYALEQKAGSIHNKPVTAGDEAAERLNAAVKDVFASVPGLFEIRSAQKKGEAHQLAAQAVAKGYGIVFACGDETIINEVASALVKTGAVLGVVPLTSAPLNPLCVTIGAPRDIRAAMRLLLEGEVGQVDVGVINGRYFFTAADMGLDAYIPPSDEPRGRPLKRLVRNALLLRELLRPRAQPVTVMTADGIWTVRPFVLRFAKTTTQGNTAKVQPSPLANDGLMDVCVVPWPEFRDRMSFFRDTVLERNPTFTALKQIRASSYEVMRKHTGPVRADGEYFFGGKSMKIKVLGGALKVLTAKRK